MTDPSRGTTAPSLVRGLGLVAAIAIVVGDVVGTGVFLKARVMTCNVDTPALVLAAWVVAGLLSVAGALTYAELSVMFPEAGGEYVFMREGYGRFWGFLFGWMRFFIGSTGGNAALAAGMATFLNVLAGGALAPWTTTLHVGSWSMQIGAIEGVAIAAIVAATLINCAAVSVSGTVATVMTGVRIILIAGLGVVAFWLADGSWQHLTMTVSAGCEGVAAAARGGVAGFGAAMMAALWAYNGWNEMTYVGGEIADPNRNLPRALVGGIGIVAILYIFINASYFYVLTPTEVAGVNPDSSVATEVLVRVLGPMAARLTAAAMVVSIFGALHVASLVCARIPYAMANDGLFFSSVAPLSTRTRVPVRALLAQGAWASVLVLTGSFDALTDYTVFGILVFALMIPGALFLLRRRMPPAAYRTWGYPVVPILFMLVTLWLVLNTLVTAPQQALTGLALIVTGLPFWWWWNRGNTRVGA